MLLSAFAAVLTVMVMGGVFYAIFRYYQLKNQKVRQKRREERLQAQEQKRQMLLRMPSEVIPTTPSSSPPPRRGRASLILVVEDSPTMLLAVRKTLELWGYKVVTAEDGRQAWAQLQKSKPDLVISDIDMPQMNGIELVKLMRSDLIFMNIPVLLMTGNAATHFEASQRIGINGLLTKPFEDRALVDQVRYLLQE